MARVRHLLGQPANGEAWERSGHSFRTDARNLGLCAGRGRRGATGPDRAHTHVYVRAPRVCRRRALSISRALFASRLSGVGSLHVFQHTTHHSLHILCSPQRFVKGRRHIARPHCTHHVHTYTYSYRARTTLSHGSLVRAILVIFTPSPVLITYHSCRTFALNKNAAVKTTSRKKPPNTPSIGCRG